MRNGYVLLQRKPQKKPPHEQPKPRSRRPSVKSGRKSARGVRLKGCAKSRKRLNKLRSGGAKRLRTRRGQQRRRRQSRGKLLSALLRRLPVRKSARRRKNAIVKPRRRQPDWSENAKLRKMRLVGNARRRRRLQKQSKRPVRLQSARLQPS
ncbi:hypothetical protein DL93DRAFT_1569182 [Clavulina sp. PMI_390]|nr:hypothetical protein DL93DRAFT_1569182 [Clavulina sp. PMI_390]